MDGSNRHRAISSYASSMAIRSRLGPVEPARYPELSSASFQEIARALAVAKQGVSWLTPSGFPVLQQTWRSKEKPIEVGGVRMTTRKSDPNLGLDMAAQQRKIVANVIHSFDSAHMVLTIDRLRREGLRFFGVIHDSYAVHGSDVDQLHSALREEFISIYQKDSSGVSVFERFFEAQKTALKSYLNETPLKPLPLKMASTGMKPAKIPNRNRAELAMQNPPSLGNLDINCVRSSDYFFC